ncbi:MAG: L,D-transpeptidase family protein [Chitinophagaceae bacterium]|nr:L,D-transpeptidase family protein [Chitinophagaceae bacterium]
MSHYLSFLRLILTIAVVAVIHSCGDGDSQSVNHASSPEELSQKTNALIADILKSGATADADSGFRLEQAELVKLMYEQNNNQHIWAAGQQWKPGADSLQAIIQSARLLGLFPEDYHATALGSIWQEMVMDSLAKNARRDAMLWAKADLMLTDAFAQLVHDIKLGRLPNDSISLNKDTAINTSWLLPELDKLKETGAFSQFIRSLEPDHLAYHEIKKGIPDFLKNAQFKTFTKVPAKEQADYKTALQKRLFEGGYIAFDSVAADSAQLSEAVKKFQKEKGLTVDGRAGEGTVRMLNLSDEEKFIRIVISLDKFKKLPAQMPEKYIWVNASSNYLDMVEDGKIAFTSRVICGKPKTRTPLLNSAVSVLITYPQWVPPPSIVSKEILPAVKKNPGYLAKKGFSLVDKDGNEVDPYSVDWSKYSKGIPYRVVQGSGDANALGIIKFHFDNKYSVYLHDTNQRYLFSNAMRSLSHGCVRVQDWQKLARYVLRTDSLKAPRNFHTGDSMRVWLANKEKHHIQIRNKMPVFIRYLTCEGREGRLQFYDDVYGEDRYLREKYYTRPTTF